MYVPRRVLLSFYNSLIVPYLTYGFYGWGNCGLMFQRVDKLADSVASLKASLEFTQKDVGDLSSLKSKLVGAIKEKLIIEVDIERAHRVERRKSGGINQHQADAKPRVIVCRLSSWKQKEAVVRKARKKKPEGLFICEDLSQAMLEKRKPHLEKLKAAKQAGKSAYFRTRSHWDL